MFLSDEDRKVLTSSETSRVQKIYDGASATPVDVAQVNQDIRAVREMRNKQRDQFKKQVRAIKSGENTPVRETNLNERTKHKEEIFERLLEYLEGQIEKS